MKQIRLNITREFERDLRRFMQLKGIRNESEAIPQAVHEGIPASAAAHFDFRSWLGLGLKAPLNPARQFCSDDDLWS